MKYTVSYKVLDSFNTDLFPIFIKIRHNATDQTRYV